ncbi:MULTISPECIES: hypothetical protein [unclassified Aeromicrobium]|uniref:hypothetical protein n=1 Tax=unclassified Aeromicrobium TaxID=2633570 RepID=UPI00288BAFA9|nr:MULTISPECIES: hypothetical protein [unclassified Aeromicrobium]
MFKDGPRHYRTFFLSCVWALSMVLVMMALSFTQLTTLTYVVFCIGAAGSALGLVMTVMHYRLSKREPDIR